MVIDHAQPALDGKVVEAEYIGPLHTKKQNHFCRPDADALQTAQGPDGVFIPHVLHRVQIERARMNLCGKIRDILRLAEGHAERLQVWDTCFQDGFGIDRAQRILHSLPDGCLCLGRDLLSDDVVNDG